VTTQRDTFLKRIKTGITDALLPEASAEHPGSFKGYTYQADALVAHMVESFTRELQALSGHVYVVADVENVTPTVLAILEQHQAKRIMTWADASLGLPWLLQALAQAGISFADSHIPTVAQERGPKMAELDGVLVGLTGAQGGLADTGTLAVISGPGQARLASLLPPVHIALLSQNKLFPSLPAFLAAHPHATQVGSNLVFITGPSRTADIELTLTMGVHGPKEIHVIIFP
jgi:L-lactate dehydrogenase complex protein LldG